MTEEIFRPIAGFEGIYAVSSLGRVRSMPRKSATGSNLQGRFIGRTEPDGRNRVTLYKGKKLNHRSVSVLVAAAFLGPALGRQVIHNDGNVSNDELSNLRYGTPRELAENKLRNGQISAGSLHHWSKLTEADVVKIRRLIAAGNTQASIARDFDIAESTVSYLAAGKTWQSVPKATG
jgi:hypothetical protein